MKAGCYYCIVLLVFMSSVMRLFSLQVALWFHLGVPEVSGRHETTYSKLLDHSIETLALFPSVFVTVIPMILQRTF